MRIVIELKRDVIPKVVLNNLYKHTSMQSTFGVNMVALVDNVPRTLNLRAVIHNYVAHQREVIVRRTKHELSEKEARARTSSRGCSSPSETRRSSAVILDQRRDREAAREQLVERFALSPIRRQRSSTCASPIPRRSRPTRSAGHADVTERIAGLRAILGDEGRVLAVIK